jgi:NADPH-dependent F420 reductase
MRSERHGAGGVSRIIAIIGGTGDVGAALATRLARAGERVVVGSRDPQRAQQIAQRILAEIGTPAKITGLSNAEAVRDADIVILAVPFEAHVETLKQLKSSFKEGSVLIDCTVPLAAAVGGRATQVLGVWQGSAAQQAAELVPKHVTVAAAFQNVAADLLSGNGHVDCDVIVCSDDLRALQIASELAGKIPGVRAIHGGKLENARVLEHLTALLIAINVHYKTHATGLRITGLDENILKSDTR